MLEENTPEIIRHIHFELCLVFFKLGLNSTKRPHGNILLEPLQRFLLEKIFQFMCLTDLMQKMQRQINSWSLSVYQQICLRLLNMTVRNVHIPKRQWSHLGGEKKLALLLLCLFAFKKYIQNIKQTRENIWIYIEYFNPFVETVFWLTFSLFSLPILFTYFIPDCSLFDFEVVNINFLR